MHKKMLALTIGISLAFSISACGNKATSPSPAPTGSASGGTTMPTSSPPSGTTQPTGTPSGNAGTASPGAGSASPGTPGAGTTTIDAQAVFKQNCVSCHGVNLEGGVGKNLQKVGSRLTADLITTTITNGHGGMPPFQGKLKPEEITALSVWLAAKK
jgi:cytochrome c551